MLSFKHAITTIILIAACITPCHLQAMDAKSATEDDTTTLITPWSVHVTLPTKLLADIQNRASNNRGNLTENDTQDFIDHITMYGKCSISRPRVWYAQPRQLPGPKDILKFILRSLKDTPPQEKASEKVVNEDDNLL